MNKDIYPPPIPAHFYNKFNLAAAMRLCKICMFHDFFYQYENIAQYSGKQVQDVIELLEETIFEKVCIEFIGYPEEIVNVGDKIWSKNHFIFRYCQVCAKIIGHLSGKKLRRELFENMFASAEFVKELPYKKYIELFPEYAKFLQNRYNADKQKNKNYSSIYKCKRCKKYNCTITRRYNRSADEGVNLTVTCENCNNSWGA